MSLHDDNIRLMHMLDHAKEVLEMTRDKDIHKIFEDRVLSLALARLLEIVGEAASKVSLETREKHKSIPWVRIIGLRNKLIHGYDTIDLDIVVNIIEKQLPLLVKQVEEILAKEGSK